MHVVVAWCVLHANMCFHSFRSEFIHGREQCLESALLNVDAPTRDRD
jgi:hypothetical protein